MYFIKCVWGHKRGWKKRGRWVGEGGDRERERRLKDAIIFNRYALGHSLNKVKEWVLQPLPQWRKCITLQTNMSDLYAPWRRTGSANTWSRVGSQDEKDAVVSLHLGYMICQPQWVAEICEGKTVHVEFVANFSVRISTKIHEILQKSLSSAMKF